MQIFVGVHLLPITRVQPQISSSLRDVDYGDDYDYENAEKLEEDRTRKSIVTQNEQTIVKSSQSTQKSEQTS